MNFMNTRAPSPAAVVGDMLNYARASGDVVSQVVRVTPEFAHFLLSINGNENRKVSKRFVKRFADDMRNGKWAINGEAIVISSCGKLNTGQHRALACIEAGVPFDTLLVVGVERSSRLTDGQGKVKLAPDYINMSKIKNGTHLAAIATGVMGLERGVINTNPKVQNVCVRDAEPTKVEINEYVSENAELLTQMLNIVPNKGNIVSRTRLAIVATWLIKNGAEPCVVRHFAEALVTGVSLDRENPIFQLRRFFEDAAKDRLIPGLAVEAMLRCWNAWVQGLTMSRKPRLQGVIPTAVVRR